MPVKVRCPECENVLTLPDQARGKVAKCPACEARVPVPGGEKKSGAKRQKAAAGAGAGKPRKPARGRAELDEETVLANLDLSRVEDRRVRVCPKCGLQVDEEDVECPKCGVGLTTGRLSAERLRKKERGGPDADKYYEKFFSTGWEFLKERWTFGLRTMMYLMVASLVGLLAAFMMLYTSKPPLKVFWGLIAFVMAMVGPGWCWFLNTTLIDYSINKKVKLDRVRFDFFLCAALGIKFFSWLIVFSAPFQVVFGTVGGLMIANGNMPAGLALIAVGFLPAFCCFPAAMSHMAMPVEWPGWVSPRLLGQYFKGMFAPCMYWCLFCAATMLPSLVLVSVIVFGFHEDLAKLVEDLNHNARVAHVMRYEEPKNKSSGGEQQEELPGEVTTEMNAVSWWFFASKDQKLSEKKFYTGQGGGSDVPAAGGKDEKPAWEREIDLETTIGPIALWFLAIVPFSFAAVFNMRTNGLFTYYYRPELELITEEKEVKWQPKRKGDGFDEDGDFDDPDELSGSEVMVGIILSGIGLIMGIIWTIQGKPKGVKMLAVAIFADLVKAGIWYFVGGDEGTGGK